MQVIFGGDDSRGAALVLRVDVGVDHANRDALVASCIEIAGEGHGRTFIKRLMFATRRGDPATDREAILAGIRGGGTTRLRSYWSNRLPPAYRSSRHRFADRNCKEVKDGRGRWGGRGSVGARPTRWRRRTHARAPASYVGAPEAGRRAPLAEGRGSGAGLARTCGDGRRAERLAGGFPCRWRGILEEPAAGPKARQERRQIPRHSRSSSSAITPSSQCSCFVHSTPIDPSVNPPESLGGELKKNIS